MTDGGQKRERRPANTDICITSDELFEQATSLLKCEEAEVNKRVRSLLSLSCQAGLSGNRQAFGNLFSQIDFLCRRHGIGKAQTMDLQAIRKWSNGTVPIQQSDVPFCVKSIAKFISSITGAAIPKKLDITCESRLSHREKGVTQKKIRKIRCVVSEMDGDNVTVMSENGKETFTFNARKECCAESNLMKVGMQLNLIDCAVFGKDLVVPQMVVVEPDFTIDISSLARCFTECGHNPAAYFINRFSPQSTSQPILLGGFSGSALDDVINKGEGFDWRKTFRRHFCEHALEYAVCGDLNAKEDFKTAAVNQANNIREAVEYLFSTDDEGFDRTKTVLEPSFVCEALGLSGRVDLMTTDFRLLVEQKSGKNYNIQTGSPNRHGCLQCEDHYVQLLLYHGVLVNNFNIGGSDTSLDLLYSKYPLPVGLVSVNQYKQLFHESMRLRNRIVAMEMDIAENGFEKYLCKLTPDTINENNLSSKFYTQYVLPKTAAVTSPLQSMSQIERKYFNRMVEFLCREESMGKMGTANGMAGCSSDAWNAPLDVRRSMGGIIDRLLVKDVSASDSACGYDTVTLLIQNGGDDCCLPNFRRGDMVYLYSYRRNEEPHICSAMLFKGVLTGMTPQSVAVHLNNAQQNGRLFDNVDDMFWAIEHGGSDVSFTSAFRSLHAFISSPASFRQLILAQRQPNGDDATRLTRSYDPHYDDVLLRMKQANDYFLLVGPPGTGKTSRMLQFIVQEELSDRTGNILLMAYTNRAVDEICAMLVGAGIDFLRMGNRWAADERYGKYFINAVTSSAPSLDDVRALLKQKRVIVGTTTAMQGHSELLETKHFDLAVIDEASQILEPNIVGLLGKVKSADGGTVKFVLIGDNKQLPAVVQQNAAMSAVNDAQLRSIGLVDCRNSLFERLLRVEREAKRTSFIGVLRYQGRMHPEVSAFPDSMFYFNERLLPVPCPHQLEQSLGYVGVSDDSLDELLKSSRTIFIPSESCPDSSMSENVNPHEAMIVADLLHRIHKFTSQTFDPHVTVGVIVPYRNQISLIKNEIAKFNIDVLNDITIDTVERYQGSQRDIIIYSFTVQQPYQLQFLTANCTEEQDRIIDRKLNVALTRARRQTIVTGNPEILRRNAIFKKLLESYTTLS